MIYVIIIGLPVFLAFLSDKTKGSLSVVLAVTALFMPVLFAAVRDVTVGTDVMTYGVWTYRSAVANGLGSFMTAQAAEAAPGYNLIAWLSGHFGSFELYLGTLQLFAIAPVYLYARRRYPGCSWPAMSAYMLLLFPISLNAMKQMIAVALCLPTFGFIERKQPFRYVICVALVCLLVHQTAVVFLVLYPVARLLMDSGDVKLAFFGRAQGFAVLVIVLGLFVVAFAGGSFFIRVFSGLKESYAYQLSASGTRVNYSALVMAAFFAFALMIQTTFKANEGLDGGFGIATLLCTTCLVAFLAVQLNMVASSMERFSYYFMAFVPLYASQLMLPSATGRSRALGLACILLLIAYFYVTCVVNGGNAVYPYTSTILGVN